MTLKEICYDLMTTIRNGHIAHSDKLSINQIALWVNAYRALLIKQDIEKDKRIDPAYTSTITIPVQMVDNATTDTGIESKTKVLESVDKIPSTLILNSRPGLLNVYDLEGNPIQVGDRIKSKY